MTKKKHLLLVILMLSAFLLAACSSQKKFESLEDLEHATFAVPSGTVADKLVLSRLPDAEFAYYDTVEECVQAVKDGTVDAAAYDEPILRYIASSEPAVALIDEKITTDSYGFAVNLDRPDLKSAVDETLKKLKSSGEYDRMVARWLPDKGQVNAETMPEIELTGENGTLKFGTAAVVPPVSFMSDGAVTGMTIELARHVAKDLGMDLEVVNMDFGQLIPSVASGEVDMAGAAITITDERSKQVLFSETTYEGGISAIVKK